MERPRLGHALRERHASGHVHGLRRRDSADPRRHALVERQADVHAARVDAPEGIAEVPETYEHTGLDAPSLGIAVP
ncbi:hypothetical protein D3C72_1883360 [compost metagenome]